MAEIVLGVLGLVIRLGKCIVVPIKRQFSYLCCFNSNVQSLNDEAKKLGDERAGLEMDVAGAKNDGREVDPKVDSWLKEVNEIQQKMNALEMEITSIQGGGCLYVKSRYSISKRAIKRTEAMKQKREDRRDISVISHPRPPPTSLVPDILERPTSEFESRKEIEEDIMAILRDEKVKIIGICGMGGIGKTTLAKKVMSRVREEKLFDKSVMAVVSQLVDKEKIQGEIAENLGLELKEKSLSSRAKILCSRLMNGERILIVLDDVWECLKLEELGIPDKDGCSILLTSRDRGVLARMDTKPILEMETLTEEEALSFFEEKLGFCVNDQNGLSRLAQEIAKECKGLPLALANVAGALKDKKDDISIWKDALQQLKSSNPEVLSEVLKDVYNPLKLSYDYLSSQNAKFIFLLCCLFPEDSNITLEDLAAYAMGLRLFDGIRELEKVRNRTYSFVNMLKSHFLLLEGKHGDERYVRMHDVVRDVAIFIASNEKQLIKRGDTSTWISPFLGERIELANGLTFPNLHLLMVDESALEELQSSGIRFEGMNELNVLSIMASSLRTLPDTTCCLKNLRTLILQCRSLMTLCFVGELENLEILICRHCGNVEGLPSETARLKRLKLLEISDCRAVRKIGAKVISSLDKLEELKIVDSFDKWEANDEKENENVGLHELESLPNLTSLDIQVKDFNLAAQQISLPRKIEKYHIAVGDTYRRYEYQFGKAMHLNLEEEITLGNWIHECVANAECLILEGVGSNRVDLGVAQKNIRLLDFRHCTTVSSLVRGCGATIVFPLLETMRLRRLYNLEEIWDIDGPISEVSSSSSLSNYSFKNLKKLELWDLPALKSLKVVSLSTYLSSISVYSCPRLLNLSPLSTSKDCFTQLQSISIDDCDMMEHVFSWNEEENEDESRLITITFPKLESLELCDLPKLRVICQGIESIECPLLTRIQITFCPQLNGHSLQLLRKEKVSFENLRELPFTTKAKIMNTFSPQIPIGTFAQLEHLQIAKLGNIKSLFSFSVAQGLDSLKFLRIEYCRKMVKVIEEDKEERLHEITPLFPHLENLVLNGLSKLKTFCNWRRGLELPKLAKVFINICPEMASFCLGSLTTPTLKSLEQLRIRNCTMMEQIFLWSEQENGKEIGQSSRDHHHITFPRLEILDLINLPRLTNFYKGIDSITLPLLTEMKMFRCPNLEGVVSATTSSSGDIDNKVVGKLKEQTIYCSLSIWNQFPIDNFTRLKELRIESFDKISFLFSSSIADNLINLKQLTIESCKNLVKVIEEEIDESHETSLIFSHLEELFLVGLPKLKTFCEWRCALELPSLEKMSIYRCPEMERFSLGLLSTPNLNNIYPKHVDIAITGDLNDVLQQRFSI